jgi:hypothetical protein
MEAGPGPFCTGIPAGGRAREEGAEMPGSVKALTAVTVTALILVTAYTVTMGSSGWLWFAWVVLVMATAGAVTTRRN